MLAAEYVNNDLIEVRVTDSLLLPLYEGEIQCANPLDPLFGRGPIYSSDPAVGLGASGYTPSIGQLYESGVRRAIRMSYDLLTAQPPFLYGFDLGVYTIVLRFVNPDTLRDHYRRIPWAKVQSLEDFEEYIGALRNQFEEVSPKPRDPKYLGAWLDYRREESDIIAAELDTSFFWIHVPTIPRRHVARAHDAHKYMIYETISHPDSTHRMLCIPQSLVDCGFFDIARTNYNMNDIDELKELIKERNLPISIIYNIPHVGADCEIERPDREMEAELAEELEMHRSGIAASFKVKGDRHPKNFYPLQDRHVRTNYMYKSTNEQHILCYDEHQGHVERIEGDVPRLRDNIFMDEYVILRAFTDNSHVVVRSYKDIQRPKIEPRTEEDIQFVFFDVECVTEPEEDCSSLPYSCSYMIAKMSKLQLLDSIEKNYNPEEASAFITSEVHHIAGFHCLSSMITRLTAHTNLEENSNCRYILVGFNNSQYDNFMLLSAMQSAIPNGEYDYVNYVEYHGANRIGNIFFNEGRCTVFDLRRHFTIGTLGEICKDFGVAHFAKRKELISHIDVQHIYNVHGRAGFFEHLHEVIPAATLQEYNNYDILSLSIIFYRYQFFLNEFECIRNVHQINPNLKKAYDQVSAASYMYRMSESYAEHHKINLPTVTYDQYAWIRSGTVAGRIETFGKKQMRYDEELMAFDVTSMYPYVMFVKSDCVFPAGDIIDGVMTQELADMIRVNYESMQVVAMGYYTVCIDQSVLVGAGKPIIRCCKTEDGNNWNTDDPSVVCQNNIVMSSVEITHLMRYGCGVVFPIGERVITFTEVIENHELFGWLTEFMVRKNEEDRLKEEDIRLKRDPPLHNACVRALCKNLLNCLSGKYMQKAYTEINVQIAKREFYSHMERTKDMVPGSSSLIGFVSESQIIMHYTKRPESIRAIKPIFVGSLIYVYSRLYMYDMLLYRLGYENCLYHDTDSVKFKKSVYDTIRHEFESALIPHLPQMELVDPRYVDHPLSRPGSKIFGAFVNELKEGNTVTFINDKKEWASFTENEMGRIVWSTFSMKGIQGGALVIDHLIDVGRFADKDARIIGPENQRRALEYDIVNNRAKRFDNPYNTMQVFEQLHGGDPVYLMNSQFIRDVRNTRINVKYILKKIEPGNNK